MSLLALAKRIRAEIEGAPAFGMDYEAAYLALTMDAGTAEDLVALRRHVDLNGFSAVKEIAWLDRRCERLARDGADERHYRAAVLLLVARVDELRRWAEGSVPLHRTRLLAVTSDTCVPGPVALQDGTTIDNVARFIGRLLTAVDYVLSRSVADEAGILEVYLEQLAALGVVARVET